MPSKAKALRTREHTLRSQREPVPLRILRVREVRAKTGLPTSTLYAWVAQGRFPKPVRLGPNFVGWLEDEIEGWLQGKIDERDDKVTPCP
jgi:prophage regulatory protein